MSRAEVYRMQVDHDALPQAPRWPPGLALRPALVASDAPAVHGLLVEAFAGSGETVPAFEAWLGWWTEDASFDPSAWFLAWADDDLAGAALCWDDGFVKDLAVRPSQRRRGVGEALLRHAFREFFARGIRTISLKVDADNPTGARRLYERVGMRVVERRPRRSLSAGWLPCRGR